MNQCFAFYENSLRAPGADYIENILGWNNDKLERCHCYIQWLFPLADERSKFNSYAPLITDTEAHRIRSHPICSIRTLHAFERMIFFMGFRLLHSDKKVVICSHDRVKFINSSPHNFLRITRMLKSMILLGLESIQASFLNALAEQVHCGNLQNAKKSMKMYWIDCAVTFPTLHNTAIRLVLSASRFRQAFILSKILMKKKCRYAEIMFKHVVGHLNVPWDHSDNWVLVGKADEDKSDETVTSYVVMNCMTCSLKKVEKSQFQYFYITEGETLSTEFFKGLWIWDTMSDIENFEIVQALNSSYIFNETQVSFVFFCKKI